MINPMQSYLQQLDAQRKQQLMQNSQEKQGFFDDQGMPIQAGYLGNQSPNLSQNPLMQQQLQQNNLTNPDQIQGAANNTGMMLGGAINRMFSSPQQQQAMEDPGNMEQIVRAKAKIQMANYVKQGMPVIDAMQKVSNDVIKAASDKISPTLLDIGVKLYDEAQKAAKLDAEIKKFTPYNMADPKNPYTNSVMVTSPAQEKQYSDMGWVKKAEIPANPDIREMPSGTDRVTRVLRPGADPTDPNSYVDLSRGQNSQLTGELPKTFVTKKEDEYSNTLTAMDNLASGINSIQGDIKQNAVGGGAYARKLFNMVGAVTGTIKAIAPDTDDKVLTPGLYKDVLSDKMGAIESAGLTDATLVSVAALKAALNKHAIGAGERVTAADIKVELKAIGGDLGDPIATAKMLERTKQDALKLVESKITNDVQFQDLPHKDLIRSRFKTLKDKYSPQEDEGIPAETPDYIKQIILRARANAAK